MKIFLSSTYKDLVKIRKSAIIFLTGITGRITNSTGEIDFMLQGKTSVVPLEVKAEENLRAKSLKMFCEKYHPKIAIRTSMSDYREQEWMINIPLYHIDRVKKYMEE